MCMYMYTCACEYTKELELCSCEYLAGGYEGDCYLEVKVKVLLHPILGFDGGRQVVAVNTAISQLSAPGSKVINF